MWHRGMGRLVGSGEGWFCGGPRRRVGEGRAARRGRGTDCRVRDWSVAERLVGWVREDAGGPGKACMDASGRGGAGLARSGGWGSGGR
jgi:hypothetical protein